MGILVKWKKPSDSDVTAVYTLADIQRATSKDGSYSSLGTQALSDNSYFDSTGTTSNWYKIRFQDTGGTVLSDFSDPIQGGTFSGYCTPDQVRLLSGIPSSVTDEDLYSYINDFATGEVNSDIAIKVRGERVLPIIEGLYGKEKDRYGFVEPVHFTSIEKPNTIDGSNTVFYTKEFPICDRNNDGVVDGDDIYAYTIGQDGTRTTITVSDVTDPYIGKITLGTAPASNILGLFFDYHHSYVEVFPNRHPLVTRACALKAGMLAWQKLDSGNYGSWRVGKVALTQTRSKYEHLDKQYQDAIYKMKSNVLRVEEVDYDRIVKRGY